MLRIQEKCLQCKYRNGIICEYGLACRYDSITKQKKIGVRDRIKMLFIKKKRRQNKGN